MAGPTPLPRARVSAPRRHAVPRARPRSALFCARRSTAPSVPTVSSLYSAAVPGTAQEFAAAWGAGIEQIALATGALGLRVPLTKLQQRTRGPGFQLPASWLSDFWQWDAAGTRMTAM